MVPTRWLVGWCCWWFENQTKEKKILFGKDKLKKHTTLLRNKNNFLIFFSLDCNKIDGQCLTTTPITSLPYHAMPCCAVCALFIVAIHCFKLRNSPREPLCHVFHLQQPDYQKPLTFFLLDDFLIHFYRRILWTALFPSHFIQYTNIMFDNRLSIDICIRIEYFCYSIIWLNIKLMLSMVEKKLQILFQ